LAKPGEYDLTVIMCGSYAAFLSNYSDHLFAV